MTNNLGRFRIDRLRRFRISSEIFLEMFADGDHSQFKITNGVPKGAVVVGIQQEYPGWVVLIIYHPSFQKVYEGEYIPELNPVVTTVH